jgi:hypothetical protein
LEIGFIDHFNTHLVTTLKYSVIADLHTLQIITAHTKSVSARTVFTCRFPVTAYKLTFKLCYDRRSVGQSVLCQALIWELRPDFYYRQTIAGLLMWALSLTRGRVCRLQLLLAFASAVILDS